MKRIAMLFATFLAALGVVFALAPATALADSRPSTNEIYVNGVSLADQSVSGVSYDPNCGELTLANYHGGNIAAIPSTSRPSDDLDLDLTIVLVGDNVISTSGGNLSDAGVYLPGGYGSLYITSGDAGGTLTINHGYRQTTNKNYIGILSAGGLVISGSAVVNVNVDTGGATGLTASGIYCSGGSVIVESRAQLSVSIATSQAKSCAGIDLGIGNPEFNVTTRRPVTIDLSGSTVAGDSAYKAVYPPYSRGVNVNQNYFPLKFDNSPAITIRANYVYHHVQGWGSNENPVGDNPDMLYYDLEEVALQHIFEYNYTLSQPTYVGDLDIDVGNGSTWSETYWGGHCVPSITVKDGWVTLEEGTDYTVSYSPGNINAGQVLVSITGIGSYYGTIQCGGFGIEPRDLSGDDISVGAIPPQARNADGSVPKPPVSVVWHGPTDMTLVEGRDYTVTYEAENGAGTAWRAYVVGQGNFTGITSAVYSVVDGGGAYGITVYGGMAKDEGASTITMASPGTIVNLSYDVPPTAGQVMYWEVLQGDVTIKVGSNTFTMPNSNVVVRATYLDNPFRDVSTSTPHVVDILWLYSTGISTGWNEKDGTVTFRPTNNVIRQDMAAFLFRLAKLAGLVNDSWQPAPETKTRFTDVNESTPHCREIWWLAESGISTGWKEKDGTYTFRPKNNVTRQDMAAFLHRLAEGPSATYVPTTQDKTFFSDVSPSTPHYNDILWLAHNEVTTGWAVGDSHEFRGMNKVVRQDMSAFLHRMYDKGLVKYAG